MKEKIEKEEESFPDEFEQAFSNLLGLQSKWFHEVVSNCFLGCVFAGFEVSQWDHADVVSRPSSIFTLTSQVPLEAPTKVVLERVHPILSTRSGGGPILGHGNIRANVSPVKTVSPTLSEKRTGRRRLWRGQDMRRWATKKWL